jgi:ABC-type transport system involved in multi-copper enzyme maturation permease subunit
MSHILTIAAASLREHSRRKLLAFFVGGSIVLTVIFAVVFRDRLGQLAFGGTSAAAVVAQGFFGTFALIGALAVSMGNIGQPFQSGEAMVILARPVSRTQYALGRMLGSLAVLAILCAILTVETEILQLITAKAFDVSLIWHWAVAFFNLSVIVAATSLFSTFIATPAIAAVIGFIADALTDFVTQFHRFVSGGRVGGTFARIIETLWYVLPKFLVSPLEGRALRGAGAQAQGFLVGHNTPALGAWAASYLVLLVVGTVVLTQRKEI